MNIATEYNQPATFFHNKEPNAYSKQRPTENISGGNACTRKRQVKELITNPVHKFLLKSGKLPVENDVIDKKKDKKLKIELQANPFLALVSKCDACRREFDFKKLLSERATHSDIEKSFENKYKDLKDNFDNSIDLLCQAKHVHKITRKIVHLALNKIKQFELFSQFHLKLFALYQRCEELKAEYPLNAQLQREQVEKIDKHILELKVHISHLAMNECLSGGEEREYFDLVEGKVEELKQGFDQCLAQLEKRYLQSRSTMRQLPESRTGN